MMTCGYNEEKIAREEIVSYFIVFAITVLCAFALSYLTKKSVGRTAAITNLSLIFLLYTCGLFKRLDVAMYLFFALTAALCIWTAVKAGKNKDGKGILQTLKHPFLAFYVVIGILFGVALLDKSAYDWDEFTHWALVVKNMHVYNNFGNLGDTTTMFNRYVPATGVFLYAFQFFNKTFVDGNLSAAMDLLIVSLLLPIPDMFGKRVNLSMVLSFTVSVALVVVQRYSVFYNILVDGILGVMAAYIYIVYLSDRGKANVWTLIEISLGVFAITATKSSGLPLACFALAFILLDMSLRGRENVKAFFKKKYRLLYLLLPVLAIVYVKVSWNLYSEINQTRAGWNSSEMTLPAIWKYLTEPNEFQTKVTSMFVRRYFIGNFHYANAGSLQEPMAFVFPLYAALTVLVCLKQKKVGFGLINFFATIIMLVSYAAYTLLLYIFSFSYGESLRLASYERYYSTLLIALSLIWNAMLFDLFFREKTLARSEEPKTKKQKIAWSSVGIVLLVLACAATGVMKQKLGQQAETFRARYKEWIVAVSDLKDTDSVFYAMCEDYGIYRGLAYLHVRYFATPTRCSGLTEGGSYPNGRDGDAFSGNPFDMSWSKERLAEEVKNYDYFWIDDATDAFTEKFGDVFVTPPEGKTLYAVRIAEDGKIILAK